MGHFDTFVSFYFELISRRIKKERLVLNITNTQELGALNFTSNIIQLIVLSKYFSILANIYVQYG